MVVVKPVCKTASDCPLSPDFGSCRSGLRQPGSAGPSQTRIWGKSSHLFCISHWRQQTEDCPAGLCRQPSVTWEKSRSQSQEEMPWSQLAGSASLQPRALTFCPRSHCIIGKAGTEGHLVIISPWVKKTMVAALLSLVALKSSAGF